MSPLLITILGVEGMFQTYDGVLDSVLHVWLHVAVWRILNKGTLHQEGESVFAIEHLQCMADQVWVLLAAVRDQVPITDRLFFCPSLSRVRVHVCWLRGVPCNNLLRVVVQRRQRFVSTLVSPPAVALSC